MRLRNTVLAGVAAAGLLCGATPATASPITAGPATRSPAPAGVPNLPGLTVSGPIPQDYEPFDDAAGHTCAFPLHLDFPVSNVVGYEFRNNAGTLVAEYFTGPLTMTVTRTDTGAHKTYDIGGSGLERFRSDGTDVLYGFGPFSSSQHPGDDPGPELTVLHGFSILRIDPDGHKTIVYSSRIENVCTELS